MRPTAPGGRLLNRHRAGARHQPGLSTQNECAVWQLRDRLWIGYRRDRRCCIGRDAVHAASALIDDQPRARSVQDHGCRLVETRQSAQRQNVNRRRDRATATIPQPPRHDRAEIERALALGAIGRQFVAQGLTLEKGCRQVANEREQASKLQTAGERVGRAWMLDLKGVQPINRRLHLQCRLGCGSLLQQRDRACGLRLGGPRPQGTREEHAGHEGCPRSNETPAIESSEQQPVHSPVPP